MSKPKPNNYDVAVKDLAIDLRRLLYLNKCQTFTLESIKNSFVCQGWIKNALNNQINAMRFFEHELKRRDQSNTWQPIQDDIDSDRLHDIALHIDLIASINNIAEITSVLQEHINEQLKNIEHATE